MEDNGSERINSVVIDDDDNERSNPDENEKQPEGWTKEDKFELLQALKAHGSRNLTQIQVTLPNKPINEIVKMIDYYRQKALCEFTITKKKKERRKATNCFSKVPLCLWAKILTDSFNYDKLQNETATAIRLIADCENIPSSKSTNNIDFREIYHALANAMEGKTLPKDQIVTTLLQKCIVETAHTSRAFIRNTTLKSIINSLDLTEKDINLFPRPTGNIELLTLRHLISQSNYNPLNIEEEYLVSSMYESNVP